MKDNKHYRKILIGCIIFLSCISLSTLIPLLSDVKFDLLVLPIVLGEVGSTIMIAILFFFIIRELIIIDQSNYNILFHLDFLRVYERVGTILLLLMYSIKQFLLIKQNLDHVVMLYLLVSLFCITLLIINLNKIYFNDVSLYICKDNKKIFFGEIIEINSISDSQVKLITKDYDYVLYANEPIINLFKNKIRQ
jgi:hypothetical protein